MRMALAALLPVSAALLCLDSASPVFAVAFSNDYVSVETITGLILSIDPAPDPFQSADIFIDGPSTCTRLWMQVLKKDALQCRPGDVIQAKGIITSDPDNDAWQINPERNDYMLLG